MRFCKYCGSEVSDTDSFCPICGKSLKKTVSKSPKISLHIPEVHKRKTQLIGLIGVVVAGLILLAVIVSQAGRCQESGCHNKAVSGSKYCYTHKCTVADCNNSKYLYSNYCYSHYLLYDDDAQTTYTTPVYSSELKLTNVTVTTSSGYVYAKGTLTNESSSTVSFVKIKGAFKSSSGTVVDTDWTYAVGSEGLAPGESCKWSLSVSSDYSIKDCDVSILDYDY